MASKPYAGFAQTLQSLMGRERLNQTQLAAAIEVSPSYISKLLSGNTQPSFELVAALSATLRAELNQLAYLTGYAIHRPQDQPSLPGWELLQDPDRAQVQELVARLAELNGATARTESESPTRSARRDHDRAELAVIYDALPRDDRVELLRVARAAHESAQRQSRPAVEEPTPLHHREGQAPA